MSPAIRSTLMRRFSLTGKYQPISSLGELADRSTFTIAGAIAQVDRKFTKKEGKPFAVVFLEDLTGTLEVVLWNETYVPVANASSPAPLSPFAARSISATTPFARPRKK